jgi:hypothetical protein
MAVPASAGLMYVRIIHRSTTNVMTGMMPASSSGMSCLGRSFSFEPSSHATITYTM